MHNIITVKRQTYSYFLERAVQIPCICHLTFTLLRDPTECHYAKKSQLAEICQNCLSSSAPSGRVKYVLFGL